MDDVLTNKVISVLPLKTRPQSSRARKLADAKQEEPKEIQSDR